MLFGLPAAHRTFVEAERQSQLSLRQPQRFSDRGKPLRKCLSRRNWVVSQKVQDGRDVVNLRGGCVAFPVGNCLFVDADLGGNLLLEEFEVQPPSADMIP